MSARFLITIIYPQSGGSLADLIRQTYIHLKNKNHAPKVFTLKTVAEDMPAEISVRYDHPSNKPTSVSTRILNPIDNDEQTQTESIRKMLGYLGGKSSNEFMLHYQNGSGLEAGVFFTFKKTPQRDIYNTKLTQRCAPDHEIQGLFSDILGIDYAQGTNKYQAHIPDLHKHLARAFVEGLIDTPQLESTYETQTHTTLLKISTLVHHAQEMICARTTVRSNNKTPLEDDDYNNLAGNLHNATGTDITDHNILWTPGKTTQYHVTNT